MFAYDIPDPKNALEEESSDDMDPEIHEETEKTALSSRPDMSDVDIKLYKVNLSLDIFDSTAEIASRVELDCKDFEVLDSKCLFTYFKNVAKDSVIRFTVFTVEEISIPHALHVGTRNGIQCVPCSNELRSP
jgi:hypothetical protein